MVRFQRTRYDKSPAEAHRQFHPPAAVAAGRRSFRLFKTSERPSARLRRTSAPPHRMQTTLLVIPLLAVACSYPGLVASKAIELDVPLAQASKVKCKTHNSNIAVCDAND